MTDLEKMIGIVGDVGRLRGMYDETKEENKRLTLEVERLKQENFLLKVCESLAAKFNAENERLRGALESIAKNSCCAPCQEAGLWAKSALSREPGKA